MLTEQKPLVDTDTGEFRCRWLTLTRESSGGTPESLECRGWFGNRKARLSSTPTQLIALVEARLCYACLPGAFDTMLKADEHSIIVSVYS